jgi:hypothetical protein
MGIINLHKDILNTVWRDDETFLCVFDNEGRLIADYDFSTGLKIVQNDKEITVYISDDDLVAGRWVFFATKVFQGNDQIQKIKIEGRKEGNPTKKKLSEDLPWKESPMMGKHVSRKEREERLDICKSCPLFNLENMTCTVNQQIVLNTTKFEDSYCPEKRWGDWDRVFMETYEKQGATIDREAIKFGSQQQQDFENELEEFLKGSK